MKLWHTSPNLSGLSSLHALRHSSAVCRWRAAFASSAISLGRWTEEYDTPKDLLRANKSSWEIHTHLPQRSLSAITRKVHVIRRELGSGTRKQPWTDDGKSRLLKAKDSGLSWVSIRAMFPKRTFAAIRTSYDRAAVKLCQKNVTPGQSSVSKLGEQEIEQIIRLRDQDGMTFLKIAQELGRSLTQVRYAYVSNVKWSPKLDGHRPWTADDLRKARDLYASGKSIKDLAACLGKSPMATYHQFQSEKKNGGVTTGPHGHWTDVKLDKLYEMKRAGATIIEISLELKHRTANSIQSRWSRARGERASPKIGQAVAETPITATEPADDRSKSSVT
ncbi:hypothetical protein Slin14017_G111670 [Septoria linicola]|nr:hypothetical protein Slin14017_G111670 [Septoria linicola]